MTGDRRAWGGLADEVLRVLADADRPLTPAQVREALGGELAYTTVMTVLGRLVDKGVATRERVGRAYAYTAINDQAELTARQMHRLLDARDDDRARVLARFVDVLSTEDEKILGDLLGPDGR
jgi:predicted transcriptional regulator